MSKRIFSDKHDQLPTSNILRTPNCYYHKQPITYFCTKSNKQLMEKNAHYHFAMNVFQYIGDSI